MTQTRHDPEMVALARAVAAEVEQFQGALGTIARDAETGQAIPLLLLEIARISFTGARLGAQRDVTPREEFQPDVPESDYDDLRMRLAEVLGQLDTYSFVFDPYDPEVVISQLSDDLVSIATDLDLGLAHFRNGDVEEALWWWQFSYLSSWGNLAGAALNALLTVGTHDRLDADADLDAEAVAAADEMLHETPDERR